MQLYTTINDHRVYYWEIVFVMIITGYISIFGFQLPDYSVEEIWEMVFPFVFALNVIGVLVALFLYLKLKDTRAKIKAIDDEGKKKIEDMFLWVKDKPKENPRWARIEQLSRSSNQSDWRIAILEADSMLDELIQKLGYSGDNMGERMLNMNSNNFPYIEEAWRVHKLRNIVAHETSYDLQRGEMEDAIDVYSLIFKTSDFI